jgi:uncharacterized protein (DUF169 family)
VATLSAYERTLTDTLQPTRRPVAIAFRDTAPDGLVRLEGSQPSGCSFWRLAAEGRSFFTLPADHHNCPIGSYTHNIPLPADRAHELGATLALMGEIGYLRMDEVPGIPRLPTTPAVTIYAPLADSPVEPDAVIVCGKPGRLMLLHEAATRAGKASRPMLGRPTCMAIPATVEGGIASSLGCVGNRVYTGLAEDEMYVVVAGVDLPAIVEALQTITSANATLTTYHESRRAELTTA